MKEIMTLLIVTLLVISTSAAQDSTPSFEYTETETEQAEEFVNRLVDDIIQQVETRLDGIEERDLSRDRYTIIEEDQDQEKSSDALTFNGDTDISEEDTIRGDLVVKNGTLTVRGTVNGDILVVNGDILLKHSAHITGNARAMNGSITKEEGSIVEGYTEESSKQSTRSRKRTSRARYSYSFKPYTWYERDDHDNFLFRYNRVEGFFFGIGTSKEYYWDGSRSLSGYGSFGYGFASHKWRMQLGLDRQFATSSGLYEFGGEAHSLTDTKDEWIMSLGENNLAALLFHEDFRDYYQREGYSVHTARYTKEGDVSTLIDVRYHMDRYSSLSQNAHWSLFGGRTFRSNPLVNEGTMRSVSMTAGLSTVEKYRRQMLGWDIYAKGEYAGSEIGGDFNFTHALIDVRRYQSISDDDRISARVRVGTLEGMPIAQRLFELGGANTMPAFGYKEFTGNRMILGNLEYQLNGDVLEEVFIWPGFLDVILFGDAGATVFVPTKYGIHEGFDAFNANAIKSDVGFALSTNNGDARLGFAWRTDKSAPVAVYFRLNKAF